MAYIEAFFYNANRELALQGKLALVVLIALCAMGLMYLLRRIMIRALNAKLKLVPANRSKTIYTVFHSIARAVIAFVALTLSLELFGINTRAILTAAGIGGVAIAFGAQSLISDVITGILMVMDGSIQVGDYVVLESKFEGTVRSMTLRKTTISAYSGALYIIPNSAIKAVTNYQRGDIRCDVRVKLPYGVTTERVEQLVERVAERAEAESGSLYTLRPYLVGVDELETLGYTIIIGATTASGNQWIGARTLRKITLSELQAEGLLPVRRDGGIYEQV